MLPVQVNQQLSVFSLTIHSVPYATRSHTLTLCSTLEDRFFLLIIFPSYSNLVEQTSLSCSAIDFTLYFQMYSHGSPTISLDLSPYRVLAIVRQNTASYHQNFILAEYSLIVAASYSLQHMHCLHHIIATGRDEHIDGNSTRLSIFPLCL